MARKLTTCYAVFSIFPALVVVVSLAGVASTRLFPRLAGVAVESLVAEFD
jgi:uncharacterized BrkB/YihY/UPF0761 family membrane protein